METFILLLSSLGIRVTTEGSAALPAYDGQYAPGIVVLSVAIAIISAIAAFDMAARVRRARADTQWMPLVAIILGGGIWSMHFIGMSAFRLQCRVGYSLGPTLLSMLPAVLGAVAVLWLDRQRQPSRLARGLAGLVLAVGIAVMHYSGMGAMQIDGVVAHQPEYLVAALVAGVVLCVTAVVAREQQLRTLPHRPWIANLRGGVALGLATSAVHYLAMAGTVFLNDGTIQPHLAQEVESAELVRTVAVVTLAVTLGSLALVFLRSKFLSKDRRIRLVLDCSSQGFVAFDRQGKIIEANPALADVLQVSVDQLQGTSIREWLVDAPVGGWQGRARRVTLLKRPDGSTLPCQVMGNEALDADGTALYSFAWIDDITERLAAESALHAAHDATQRMGQRLQVLLDHSGQGFLVIGPELRVLPGWSAECARMLGESPEGKSLPTLLASTPSAAQELDRHLNRLFSTKKQPVRQTAYLELLPTQLRCRGLDLRAHWTVLDGEHLMLMLTDITETLRLQAQAQSERQRVDFLVNAMENRTEVMRVVESWRHQRGQWLQCGTGDDPSSAQECWMAALQSVHTYKGLFSQEAFPTIPSALHQLETHLLALNTAGTDWARLRPLLERALADCGVDEALQADLSLLKQQLGIDLEGRNATVAVPLETLRALEAAVGALQQGRRSSDRAVADPSLGTRTALQPVEVAMRRLFLVPLSHLMETQLRAARSLARAQGKRLRVPPRDGPEVYVDPGRLQAFVDSLVHIMRNAVDHGLEPPEEREALGKPPEGVLRWTTAVNGRQLSLCIEDDGRGVAEETLVRRAVELCLVRPEAVARMDTAQRLDLVFAHGLSSRSEVNAVSGRGIGLSAVRSALQALHGSITLFSRPGHGCVFQIELPLVEPEYVAHRGDSGPSRTA